MKKGEAAAIVSAGHTGAAVAATTIKLRTLPGIDRPGIAAVIPSETNIFVLIDAGANSDAKPEHLLQYGIMGLVYSRHVLGYQNPSIGLMSIGGEDVKGTDLTKEVFKMLKRSELNFRGNIEGHDLFAHPVEVVVCDGFVGNVILKTCESVGDAIFKWLKHELMKSKVRMAGAFLAQKAFKAIKKRVNYEEYGGSPFLGVNGICIIAHGASTPLAIKTHCVLRPSRLNSRSIHISSRKSAGIMKRTPRSSPQSAKPPPRRFIPALPVRRSGPSPARSTGSHP